MIDREDSATSIKFTFVESYEIWHHPAWLSQTTATSKNFRFPRDLEKARFYCKQKQDRRICTDVDRPVPVSCLLLENSAVAVVVVVESAVAFVVAVAVVVVVVVEERLAVECVAFELETETNKAIS